MQEEKSVAKTINSFKILLERKTLELLKLHLFVLWLHGQFQVYMY